MGIIESIVGIVISSTVGALGVGAVGLNVIGATIVAGVIWGGNAISKSLAPKKDSTQTSPTYQFNSLQTQTNNQLPIALIYGENKIAGNRIWQELRNNNTQIDRIIALGQGEIEAITDMRLNDLPIESLGGVTVRTYLGTGAPESPTPTKPVDVLIAGDETQKIQTVGSLKGLAYVALSVIASEKVRADYNFTTIVKGRKVRVYQDIDHWTYEYSNNPAWCLLDFLICYNGCGLGLLEDGSLDDNKIKEAIDIQSFIESAEYCDEMIIPEVEPSQALREPAASSVVLNSVQDLSEQEMLKQVQHDSGASDAPKVKRFTFNMIIDSRAPRHEIIEEFKKACRGALTLKGKKLQFKIDRPNPPCKEITAADIIPGSEQYSTIANEENYDRIIVKYRSKENDWAICEAIAEKSTFDNIPPVEHEVNIYGVTDFNQASRLAWYYLNKLLQERETGYFETDSRAFDLEIGDVILLSDNLMGFQKILVKITQLGDMQDGRFGVHWRVFKEQVFRDTLGSFSPSNHILLLGAGVPSIVKNFIVSQNFVGMALSWELANQDLKYEVRAGSTWHLAELVATNLTSGSLFLFATKTGWHTFLIKAKNQYGIYSTEAASASIYIANIPNINTILKHNPLRGICCLKGLKIYNNALKAAPKGLWNKLSLLSKAQMRAINGEVWKSFHRECWTHSPLNGSASLMSEIFDLGTVTETLVILNSSYFGAETGNCWYFRTSLDGNNWTAFELLTQKLVTLRYYQLKFEPSEEFFLVKKPVLSLDVADRAEYYQDIELDAENGTTIEFAKHPQSKLKQGFFKEVSAIASLNQGMAGFCVVYEKTLNYIKIRALSPDGVGIAGVCDVHVKGF